MSKAQNEVTWGRFKAAPNGIKDMATRGFRVRDGRMMSAYYDKRYVLPDGIHTEAIEFHLSG